MWLNGYGLMVVLMLFGWCQCALLEKIVDLYVTEVLHLPSLAWNVQTG